MIPSAVFHVAVAQQNKIPLSNKFSRNLGNMPKTYTHALSTSEKYMTGFLVKSFGECCRSSLWCWRPAVTARQITVFLLTIGVGGVELQPFTVVLDSDKGAYCHHTSSYSISGSRNYTPQAKSDPRNHFIRTQNTFCQYEKIYIYKKCVDLVECNISRNNHITSGVRPSNRCAMAYVALSQKMWRPMIWIEPGFLKRGPRPPLGDQRSDYLGSTTSGLH